MFDNIGGKIKFLAQISTIIGIIGYLILGLIICNTDEDFILIGVLIIFIGAILSWVSSFLLYGFGELIENSSVLVKHIKSQKVNEAIPKVKHNFESSFDNTSKDNNKDNNSNKTQAENNYSVEPIVTENNEEIICPICQTKQRNDRLVCWSCGQKFDKTDTEQCERCGKQVYKTTRCFIDSTVGWESVCDECKNKYN